MPPFSADFQNFIFKEGEDCPELTPSREVKAGFYPLMRSVRLCTWIRWPCLWQMNVHGTQGLWHSFSGWAGWKWDIYLSYWEKRANKKKIFPFFFSLGRVPNAWLRRAAACAWACDPGKFPLLSVISCDGHIFHSCDILSAFEMVD